jgi:hypothetical protein
LCNGAPSLARSLEGLVENPSALAARLVLEHSAMTAPTIARQLLRSYAPGMLAVSLLSKRARRGTLGVVLLAGLGRWYRSERHLDAVRFVALSTADDLSYSAGLWAGALRDRRLGALVPDVLTRSSGVGDARRVVRRSPWKALRTRGRPDPAPPVDRQASNHRL